MRMIIYTLIMGIKHLQSLVPNILTIPQDLQWVLILQILIIIQN